MPDAHDPSKKHQPGMLTTDIALRVDPIYEKIARDFYANPDKFADAFARAVVLNSPTAIMRSTCPVHWSGFRRRADLAGIRFQPYDHPLVEDADIKSLKQKALSSGLSVSDLVSTAWASALELP